jgi:hypothetical protein
VIYRRPGLLGRVGHGATGVKKVAHGRAKCRPVLDFLPEPLD